MRRFHLVAAVLVLPVAACTQKPAPTAPQAPSVGPQTLPAEQQVALAVLPLPKEFPRGSHGARLRFRSGTLVTLRQGTGHMICLMSDPKGDGFHPACYQDGMEPFMARGRAFRGHGVKNLDSARFSEVKAGTPLKAARRKRRRFWAMDGPWSGVNTAAGTVTSGDQAALTRCTCRLPRRLRPGCPTR